MKIFKNGLGKAPIFTLFTSFVAAYLMFAPSFYRTVTRKEVQASAADTSTAAPAVQPQEEKESESVLQVVRIKSANLPVSEKILDGLLCKQHVMNNPQKVKILTALNFIKNDYLEIYEINKIGIGKISSSNRYALISSRHNDIHNNLKELARIPGFTMAMLEDVVKKYGEVAQEVNVVKKVEVKPQRIAQKPKSESVTSPGTKIGKPKVSTLASPVIKSTGTSSR